MVEHLPSMFGTAKGKQTRENTVRMVETDCSQQTRSGSTLSPVAIGGEETGSHEKGDDTNSQKHAGVAKHISNIISQSQTTRA